CFADRKRGKESVFNSDMVLHFLDHLVGEGEPPKSWVDNNVRTDYAKLKVIADIQRRIDPGHAQDSLPVTEELAVNGEVQFPLKESFPADSIPKPDNFKSLFFYYGIVSKKEERKGLDWFCIPNNCVREQVFDYLREHYTRKETPDWSEWNALASAFAYDGNWRPFLQRLAADFAATNSVRGGIQGEVRIQGYMQAEFGHLDYYLMEPEMELSHGFCDFCLFPDRIRARGVAHSYLVELKYSAKDAPEAEIAAQYAEALDQLARCRADPSVPTLASGTILHQIVFQFKGSELVRLAQINEEGM
ncbi:MAG: PD-(D/E)XK nuclease domain-containing protein, partial [Kiritimatiellae bacterium]|nr:PD-(D/E)XK nuclease domain-containing protein [Kiritimatiellia bacterium]